MTTQNSLPSRSASTSASTASITILRIIGPPGARSKETENPLPLREGRLRASLLLAPPYALSVRADSARLAEVVGHVGRVALGRVDRLDADEAAAAAGSIPIQRFDRRARLAQILLNVRGRSVALE